MNMIVGKKQIVLASLVAALGVAVYLNYQFAGEDLELVTANTTQQTAVEGALEETQEQEHYGDAQFVDSKQVARNAQEDGEYFSQARLTRQKTRDQAQEALQVMLTDTALTQEQKDELTAQAGGMVQAIETEGESKTASKQRALTSAWSTAQARRWMSSSKRPSCRRDRWCKSATSSWEKPRCRWKISRLYLSNKKQWHAMPHQMCGMACHFSCRNSAG